MKVLEENMDMENDGEADDDGFEDVESDGEEIKGEG